MMCIPSHTTIQATWTTSEVEAYALPQKAVVCIKQSMAEGEKVLLTIIPGGWVHLQFFMDRTLVVQMEEC